MEHAHEGLIQAYLDGEAGAEEGEALRAHLAACPECRARAGARAEREALAARALALLDVEPPTELARRRVLRRTAPPRTFSLFRLAPARAAGVALLLTASGAAALPGSPLREWIVDRWDRPSPMSAPATREGVDRAAPPAAAAPRGEAGASISVWEGGVELHILGLLPGAEIRVLLVEGSQAGIFAPGGGRFRTGAGRLEASELSGPVRVELPLGAPRASVWVNGVLYLRKTGAGLELLGPVGDSLPGEIRFLLPTGGGGGSSG